MLQYANVTETRNKFTTAGEVLFHFYFLCYLHVAISNATNYYLALLPTLLGTKWLPLVHFEHVKLYLVWLLTHLLEWQKERNLAY